MESGDIFGTNMIALRCGDSRLSVTPPPPNTHTLYKITNQYEKENEPILLEEMAEWQKKGIHPDHSVWIGLKWETVLGSG